ncbi:MAG TPA: UDP-N-acetylmuramate dehydrogenase [Acidobacteriaceae bacterium]|nr:UDP-N-acetylmuramate dehydrogenase [Acidobacteriaceae bacterium]
MHLQEHVPLAPYTTFGIGGPARWFVEAGDEESVVEAMRFAREKNQALFVLGGGSNLLVSDQGFPGLVLHIALQGIAHEGSLFRVAAGENWDSFVSHAIGAGYGGIECLAGIPGTVGGTPVQNVGAYGQEVADTIASVRVLDRDNFTFSEMPASDCGFSYRRSIFNSTHRDRFIVTRVDYKLRAGSKPVLQYPDLRRFFQDRPEAPSLAETAAAVREIRHRKGMLLVEGESDCRSAGSFFKNPIVPQAQYDAIAARESVPVPSFPAEAGFVKIPAAWLVEHAGFHKGYTLGKAGISSRHTLALINRGDARAAEIVALRDRIVQAVEGQFSIRLEPEPVWLGPKASYGRPDR